MGKAIMDSMAVFTEAFEQIHLMEEDLAYITSRVDFIHLFSDVKDFRVTGKTKYKLGNLLMLILLVKYTTRSTSFFEIALHIRAREKYFSELGLIEDHQCPSHDTLRRVMMCLDGNALQEQTIVRLYDFLRDLEKEIKGSARHRQLAMDGKEMCGSGRSEKTEHPLPNQQLFNIYDCGLATCIHCESIDSKTNEIPVGQAILEAMDLGKTVLTADALHCQRDTTKIIRSKRGHYVLAVKDNQKLLKQEAIDRMAKDEKKVRVIERDKRTFSILRLPKGYAVDGFTGMKAFVKMTSRIRKETSEIFFISSTDDEDLICEAIESRWGIENDLHKEKDVYFDEDSIRYTNKNAVRNMAILNNLALQIIRIDQMISSCELRESKVKMLYYPIETITGILAVMNSSEMILKIKKAIRKVSSKK